MIVFVRNSKSSSYLNFGFVCIFSFVFIFEEQRTQRPRRIISKTFMIFRSFSSYFFCYCEYPLFLLAHNEVCLPWAHSMLCCQKQTFYRNGLLFVLSSGHYRYLFGINFLGQISYTAFVIATR